MVNYFDKVHIGREFGAFKVVGILRSNCTFDAIWEMKCGKCNKTTNVISSSIFVGNEIKCYCGNSYKYEGEAKVINQLIQSDKNLNGNEVCVSWTFNNEDRQRLRKIRQTIIDRCYNENNTSYHLYGGIGIGVSVKWLEGVDNFVNWSVENGYRPWLKLRRKNKEWDYCENNCFWGNIDNVDNDKIGKMDLVEYLGMGIDIDKLIDDINSHTIDINTVKEGMKILKDEVGDKLIGQVECEKLIRSINKNMSRCYETIYKTRQILRMYEYIVDKKPINTMGKSATALNKVLYELIKIISNVK